MRVLLVDDDEQVNRAMLRLLKRQPGLTPVAVANVDGALDQLTLAHFDAVMVDHHLGAGVSGVELLREIRARWPAIHRVLCSGGTLPGDDPHATEAAHALLCKPATMEQILEALRPIESEPRAAVA